MADKRSASGVNPAKNWQGITPDDSTDLTSKPRSLFIGVGGDLELMDEDGDTEIFYNVPNGFILPVQPKRVLAANTTASAIIALF